MVGVQAFDEGDAPEADPPVTPYYSAFLSYAQQYNPSLFDVLGRRFVVGAKVAF